jgi:hypothetical protein
MEMVVMTSAPKRTVAAVLGALTLQALMIIAFAWPSARIAPRDLPLVVAGPQNQAAAVTGRLTAERPDAFTIARVADERAARDALADRKAYGAIVLTPAGPRVLVASAASPPVAQMLTQLAQRMSGAPQPAVQDVVPADRDDPRGTGFGAMALPLVITGIAGGVLLTVLISSIAWRLTGLITFAALGGLIIGWVAEDVLSIVGGSYLAVSGALGLSILAVAGTITGLAALLGRAGVALGALTLLVVGNPLSGAVSAPELLPRPWGAVGQWLPPGAGATLLRSVGFFDGARLAGPLTVLLAWGLAGILLTALGVLRRTGPDEPVAPASSMALSH